MEKSTYLFWRYKENGVYFTLSSVILTDFKTGFLSLDFSSKFTLEMCIYNLPKIFLTQNGIESLEVGLIMLVLENRSFGRLKIYKSEIKFDEKSNETCPVFISFQITELGVK